MNCRAILILSIAVSTASAALVAAESPVLRLSWERDILTIAGDHLPGKTMKILYIEAYCRPNSQTTDWATHTVVGHRTELALLKRYEKDFPDQTRGR